MEDVCKKKRKNLLPVPLSAVTMSSEANKSPQKAFSPLTTLFHHVSRYHSQAFRCRRNPYLGLFNLYCCLLLTEGVISRYWLSGAARLAEGLGASRLHSRLWKDQKSRTASERYEWRHRRRRSHRSTAWCVRGEQEPTRMNERAKGEALSGGSREQRDVQCRRKGNYWGRFFLYWEMELVASSICLYIVYIQ